MKELKKITAVILTYKTSKKTILNCLNSLSSNISIIIIENSNRLKINRIKMEMVFLKLTFNNLL